MAGVMIEAVAGELSKLREKVVRMKAIGVGHSLSKLKAARAAAAPPAAPLVAVGCNREGEGNQSAKGKSTRFVVDEEEEEGCLSESTVCLLMDRFVPY